MYSNSLMATVNSRKSYMESAATSREVSSYALSEFGAASNPAMRGALSAGSTVSTTIPNARREVRILQNLGCDRGSGSGGAIFIKETRCTFYDTYKIYIDHRRLLGLIMGEKGRRRAVKMYATDNNSQVVLMQCTISVAFRFYLKVSTKCRSLFRQTRSFRSCP